MMNTKQFFDRILKYFPKKRTADKNTKNPLSTLNLSKRHELGNFSSLDKPSPKSA